MIYFKSTLAGIVAVFVAGALTILGMLAYMRVARVVPANGPTQWDPISLTRPLTLIFVLGAFLIGFAWEFHRTASK